MRRLIHYVGRRGLIMGFFGFISLVIGFFSLGQPIPHQALVNAQYLIKWVPLNAWYFFWTLTGLLLTLSVFVRILRPLAVGAFSFICGIFSLGYFAAQAFGEGNVVRAWVSGVLYGGFSLVMLVVAGWPEEGEKQ